MVTPVATEELPAESMLVDGSQPTWAVALGGGVEGAASSGAASMLSMLEVRRSPCACACARDRVLFSVRLSLSDHSPQEAKRGPRSL